MKPLVIALTADDDIDLLDQLAEGERLFLEFHASGFNAAHIQDVIDDGEQMAGTGADLLQEIPGVGRN